MNIAHAAEGGITIHLASPVLGHFFGIPLTSTMVAAWLTMAVLAFSAVYVRAHIQLIPGKIQVIAELLIGGAFDYISGVLESREMARRFFPLIMTIFIFILGMNWIGLLPGVDAIGIMTNSHGEEALIPFLHPANTDLNMTIAIAIIAFCTIEIAGVLFINVKR